MLNLTPNINRAGRTARGLSGGLFLLIAIHAALSGYPAGGALLRWTVAVLALIFGGVQIFEAASGWCIMRALGFRTPM